MPPMTTSSMAARHSWRVLTSSLKAKVSLQMTLCGGQCFHWYRTPRGTFVGAIGDGVFELREVQCSAKLKKQELQRTAPQPPVPARARRRHAASAPASTLEAAVGESDCCPCCWIEYRRLWPLAQPVRLSGKGRTSPLSSSLRHTGASSAPAVWESDEEMLSRYLSLDVDLDQLWQEWTDSPETRKHPLVEYLVGNRLHREFLRSGHGQRVCEHDEAQANLYIPIRHVRQDLHSCLFSFLCSQNNNVTRITGMIYALSRTYGDHLCDVQLATGEVQEPRKSAADTRSKVPQTQFQSDAAATRRDAIASPSLRSHSSSTNSPEWLSVYSFPSLEQLAAATEDTLRNLGFGYRSKYIVEAVSFIRTHNTGLADCVALFALNRTHIVPVDTHMAQVAVEYLAAPSAAAAVGRKRSRPGCLLSEEEAQSPDNLLLEWRKQAEALKVKKGASPATVKAIEEGRSSAASLLRASRKTPVPPLYERHHNVIQDAFWKLFGNYAGWAHSILFYYRLRK
ncbi:8-oxoguanine DNA glycosylase, N-terminal domain family protein [Leishmania donovani]|uniref:DNA-(apurinic or apyrimidinic site) lyase n=1 Tax=Leishmania donovani TaxID=5661 RepID=A0A504XPB1_LEIDO|nr:8-oxoguanine DNA glycosylase, N-terminal domain family protein [Leishmania donovani]